VITFLTYTKLGIKLGKTRKTQKLGNKLEIKIMIKPDKLFIVFL